MTRAEALRKSEAALTLLGTFPASMCGHAAGPCVRCDSHRATVEILRRAIAAMAIPGEGAEDMSGRKGLPEPTQRGLLRPVRVGSERWCWPHDWTRDASLSHCLRYGYDTIGPDGSAIDRRTIDVCAASAMDLLQDLVEMPARKREAFVRAIRKEMARKTGSKA